MPLVDLLNVPRDQNGWENYSFANREQLNAIRQAIFTQKNINLTEYQLYPINFNDFTSWLENVQHAHDDFNSVLGLQSSDIESVDPKNPQQLEAWIYLVYQEVFDASAALKI